MSLPFNGLLRKAKVDAVSRTCLTVAVAGYCNARSLFSFVDRHECVPECHQLRLIRWIAIDGLANLDAEFDGIYAGSQSFFHCAGAADLGQPSANAVLDPLRADMGYTIADFVATLRRMKVALHVALRAWHSVIAVRTKKYPDYFVSQTRGKKIAANSDAFADSLAPVLQDVQTKRPHHPGRHRDCFERLRYSHPRWWQLAILNGVKSATTPPLATLGS